MCCELDRKTSVSIELLSNVLFCLLVLTGWAIPRFASAQQPVVYLRSCAGCTHPGMVAQAKNGPDGINFIYDLQGDTIRKYAVTSTQDCGPYPTPYARSANKTPAKASISPDMARTCNTIKQAFEMPVDQSIMPIFNAMVSVYRANPNLLARERAQLPLRNFPNDPDTYRPFDLSEAAWDYPQGTYYRFVNAVLGRLSNRDALADFDPTLADFIYGVNIPLMDSLKIDVGLTGSVPSGSVQATVVWDHGSDFDLAVCDEVGNCANFVVSANRRSELKIKLNNVTDLSGNFYPEPGANIPPRLEWSWAHGSDAENFANRLSRLGHAHVEEFPAGGCYHGVILSCSWERNGPFIGCRYDCK